MSRSTPSRPTPGTSTQSCGSAAGPTPSRTRANYACCNPTRLTPEDGGAEISCRTDDDGEKGDRDARGTQESCEDTAAPPGRHDEPEVADGDGERCGCQSCSHVRLPSTPQPRTLTARATTRRIVIRAMSDWV